SVSANCIRVSMPNDFVPLASAEGCQISNPAVFAAAPLMASFELFDRTGIDALRAKSIRLTGYLALLLRAWLEESVEIVTPSAIEARGCQLSLRLKKSRDEPRAI